MVSFSGAMWYINISSTGGLLYPRSSGGKGLGQTMLTNISQVCKTSVPSTFYYGLSATGQQCGASYSTSVSVTHQHPTSC